MSREFRARLGRDNSKATPVAITSPPQHDTKPVVCFSCHVVGHKSPQCPKKQIGSVKRVEIPVDKVKALSTNEVMAETSGVRIPHTVDLGDQMTIVPLEVVKPDELTGATTTFNVIIDGEYEGELAKVRFSVGSDVFHRKAVAVPRKKIDWTAAMSVEIDDKDEWGRV